MGWLATPFSVREKVSRLARRMRAPGSANPHPYPPPNSPPRDGRSSERPMREGKTAPRAKLLFLLALLAALTGPALAVQPDEVMKDPALETRARALSGELRCLVCQNESIDDSEAPLARDIRVLIRERIGKGESNDAVRAYLVSRYGDFILLKPPFKPETLLLWLSPVLTLGLGVAAALYARRRAPRATLRLSDEEEARLAALIADDAH
jgi:cytochrome c-type biogenesis protein CcmH